MSRRLHDGDDLLAETDTDFSPPPCAVVDPAAASAAASVLPAQSSAKLGVLSSEMPDYEKVHDKLEKTDDAEVLEPVITAQPARRAMPTLSSPSCGAFDGLSDAVSTCPRQVSNDATSAFFISCAAGQYLGVCAALCLPEAVGECVKGLVFIGVFASSGIAGTAEGAGVGTVHGLFNIVRCREASEDPCCSSDDYDACVPS